MSHSDILQLWKDSSITSDQILITLNNASCSY